MLNRNASVNRLEKENEMKITQKKKRSINGNKKMRHQEYMLNSIVVITDCNKSKNDTVIQGNINNKESNESINNNDTGRFKTKVWPRGTCLCHYGGLMLGHIDETRMKCPENLK